MAWKIVYIVLWVFFPFHFFFLWAKQIEVSWHPRVQQKLNVLDVNFLCLCGNNIIAICCLCLTHTLVLIQHQDLRAKIFPPYYVFIQGVCGCARFSSSSIGEVFRVIVKRDGYAGLMRGWMPRMLFHAPAAAICWSTYEAAKSFFKDLNDRNIASSNSTDWSYTAMRRGNSLGRCCSKKGGRIRRSKNYLHYFMCNFFFLVILV